MNAIAHIYAGTSGWAYPTWRPDFYPAKLATNKFLAHYAARLNTVEVNYTFRRFPTEKILTAWIASTPPHFQFAMKANQVITHIKRLKDTDENVRRFLDSIQPLAQAGRLGPVLFQLPPNLKADVPLLEAFLAGLPHASALRCSFEFRHASWFADATFEILRRHNAALCIAEAENLTVPDVATAEFCYYRFRMPDYAASEVAAIEARVNQHRSAGRDVYAYFKHEDTPAGALNAEQLLAHLAA
jgi:uncharacterized protein YecE (DUF72 family)